MRGERDRQMVDRQSEKLSKRPHASSPDAEPGSITVRLGDLRLQFVLFKAGAVNIYSLHIIEL